jgi:hypothetical protein
MYFRFGAALVLAVLVAVAGIGIEKRCLTLRRALSREHYRYEVLRDLYARQRLRTQQLGAPARLFEALESDRRELVAHKSTDAAERGKSQIADERGNRTRD